MNFSPRNQQPRRLAILLFVVDGLEVLTIHVAIVKQHVVVSPIPAAVPVRLRQHVPTVNSKAPMHAILCQQSGSRTTSRDLSGRTIVCSCEYIGNGQVSQNCYQPTPATIPALTSAPVEVRAPPAPIATPGIPIPGVVPPPALSPVAPIMPPQAPPINTQVTCQATNPFNINIGLGGTCSAIQTMRAPVQALARRLAPIAKFEHTMPLFVKSPDPTLPLSIPLEFSRLVTVNIEAMDRSSSTAMKKVEGQRLPIRLKFGHPHPNERPRCQCLHLLLFLFLFLCPCTQWCLLQTRNQTRKATSEVDEESSIVLLANKKYRIPISRWTPPLDEVDCRRNQQIDWYKDTQRIMNNVVDLSSLLFLESSITNEAYRERRQGNVVSLASKFKGIAHKKQQIGSYCSFSRLGSKKFFVASKSVTSAFRLQFC